LPRAIVYYISGTIKIINIMQIIKWEPFGEVDKFFDDRIFPSFPVMPKLGMDLAVDIYEEKDKVIAKMSLPGIKSDELDISLEDDMLTISGSREEEKEVDKKDYYSKEIKRGSFSRSVRLPKAVDSSKTEAEYKDGVLVVTMPVVEGSKEKSVKIKLNK